MPPYLEFVFSEILSAGAVLSEFKSSDWPTVVVANAENAAGGFGLTQRVYE